MTPYNIKTTAAIALLHTILDNLKIFSKSQAFFIEGESYAYEQLEWQIIGIQQDLIDAGYKSPYLAAVYTHDDLYTYASILAIWLMGGTYVPIDPGHPKERNEKIIAQVHPTYFLSSKAEDLLTRDTCSHSLVTSRPFEKNKTVVYHPPTAEQLMYILFTSGSTGIPKGVAIQYQNLTSYITENRKLYPDLTDTDRFLQIYALTFDASLQSFLLPLYIGASIYTVSPKKIKYLEALKLMQQHDITFAKISNTVIHYLQPYFQKIQLPALRYCLFAGEALHSSLVDAWRACVPNATLMNVYGPTEATVNTHYYRIPEEIPDNKSHHGVLTFGKPFGDNLAMIVNTDNHALPPYKQGELCLGGPQITQGYWFDELRNRQSFFTTEEGERYYRTGDIAYMDDDGDFFFCGRMGDQVKIQGYRVELQEIEYHANQYGQADRYKALAVKNKMGTYEIVLFTENDRGESGALQVYLTQHLPHYMVPQSIIGLAAFPLNAHGKVDGVMLQSQYRASHG